MHHDPDRMPGQPRPEPLPRPDRRGAGRSNLLAFVIGGLALALGSLAFVYQDGKRSARDLVVTEPAGRETGRGLGLIAPPRP